MRAKRAFPFEIDDNFRILAGVKEASSIVHQEFVVKNEMTWAQYFDGGFAGPVARIFDVHSIPHTFTIDADGVLQDEQIGDGSIDGKLKKLIARAKEIQAMITLRAATTSGY